MAQMTPSSRTHRATATIFDVTAALAANHTLVSTVTGEVLGRKTLRMRRCIGSMRDA
jgi:hypothetical protein